MADRILPSFALRLAPPAGRHDLENPAMRLTRLVGKLGKVAAASGAWSINNMIARRGQPDVVFLGDSITRFWLEADPWLFWPRRVNLGVPGYTTGQMLDRFERDVTSLAPKALHVMGGTNDLWYGEPGPEASASVANLIQIAKRAKALGIRVILASPPPIAPHAEHLFASAGLFPTLRSALQRYCRSAGVLHVDYAQSLVDEDGVLRPSFTTDGVHLTRSGYVAMRNQAKRTLQQAL